MSIVSTHRQSSADEFAKEMDRRGAVIEALEAKLAKLEEIIRDLDAVGVDFGHYEEAARTMKAMVDKAVRAL